VVAAGIWFAGCVGGTGSAIEGPVTVTFWHSQEGAAAELLEEMAAEFSTVQPNIAVDPVYCGEPAALASGLLEAYGSGNAPVLAEVPESALPALRTAEVLVPLQDYIADRDFGLEVADLDDFWPCLVESNTTGRGVWGLPFSHRVYALVYNPELVADPPRTWEALMETAASLTHRDPDPARSTFGLAVTDDPNLFCVLLFEKGGALVKGQPPAWAFNDPAGVAALNYLYELASLRKCVLVTVGSPSGAVADDRAAMAIDLVGWPGGGRTAGSAAEPPVPAS